MPFIFDSVSYKKGIDIITESQQLKLAETLLENGYTVIIIESLQVIKLIENLFGSKYSNRLILSDDNTFKGFNVNI
jgi:UDP-N-acetyl-D-mannosaminuronate dehydrogenase